MPRLRSWRFCIFYAYRRHGRLPRGGFCTHCALLPALPLTRTCWAFHVQTAWLFTKRNWPTLLANVLPYCGTARGCTCIISLICAVINGSHVAFYLIHGPSWRLCSHCVAGRVRLVDGAGLSQLRSLFRFGGSSLRFAALAAAQQPPTML